ncbi:hypothetical protein RAD16_09565 [Bradyrhizobium sp. 18BD]
MRRATLLALGLMVVGLWPLDCASAQTAPPVSLAPPKASPPRANAKNAPAASAPAPGALPQAPNPAADYDGFSVGGEVNDTPDQAARPTTSRAAKGAKSDPDPKGNAAQQLIDQEDEALKRKLSICKNCK